MKKVLFCAYNLDVGGIETSLLNMLNNFDYDKYEVTVVLEKKEGLLFDKLNKKVKVLEYKLSNDKNVIFRKAKNLFKKLFWIVKNYHKYDFSCCYATYSMANNFQGYYGSKNNAIFIHSNYVNIYHTKEELDNFFLIRRIYKYRRVIFVSNESKIELLKYYPEIESRSLVINNQINCNEIKELSREKINVKKVKDNLFVFVGRLDETSKRISKMINVIGSLDNAELWIIGDGPNREMYEEMIKKTNNIKILGAKTNPYPYMNAADYIILTSDYEGFPVVYNEAIILGKKIITTIDVSDEVISIKNRFGYIVSKDEKKMRKQIEEILAHDDLKCEKVDFNEINKNRMKLMEEIFDEVI